MSEFTPPPEFDGYRLMRLLGRGGMGEVHLAHDSLLDRHVAIKFISSSQADREARQRFLVEARAIARLQHPNVVSVYRVGEVEGYPYLVSEYVRGVALDALDLPVPGEKVLAIAHDIACALAAAHQRGVLHRDIKPANAILSDEGQVKLLDFGIAKLLEPVGAPIGLRASVAPSGQASPTDTTVVQAAAAMMDAEDVDDTEIGAPPSLALRVDEHDETTVDNDGLAGITDPGVALGTPRYMAPEVWRGEGATFRSDIYSFGALVYALASGIPPISGKSAAELYLRVQFEAIVPLGELAPDLDPRLCDVVHRCLERDPSKRFAAAGELRSAVAALLTDERDRVLSEGNPYRGLHAFEAEHRGQFFGRDSEIRMILDRLSNEAFVLVAGDSGVGKSSLCRAGVLPRLGARLGIPGELRSARIVPGRHPVRALAEPLSALLGKPQDIVEQAVKDDPAGVAREVRQVASGSGFVLLVDQLEELLTLSDEGEAAAACELLGWLTEPSAKLRVLASVRGDFLSRLAQLPVIGDAVSRALYFLRPLSRERIRDVIVGPAQSRGVKFETEELVAELVSSTERARGGLPLLQFALAELWDARRTDEPVIRRAALSEIGGVEGALARHADSVLATMQASERSAAQKALCGLVTAEGTRARLLAQELGGEGPLLDRALESLVHGRLLVAGLTPSGTTYEIAHEVLVHGWPTLASWLSTDAESRVVHQRLGMAAREWDRLHRPSELLYARAQLAELWVLERDELLAVERAFVDRSTRRQRLRRALAFSAVLVALLVVVAIYGGVTYRTQLELSHKVGHELATGHRAFDRARSVSVAAMGVRQEALALFDKGQEEEAERRWLSYQERLAPVERLVAEAGRRFEAAMLLDGDRLETRSSMADFLLWRILDNEDQGRPGASSELEERLSLYDTDGSRRRQLNQAGNVRFEVEAPAAHIELFVVEAAASGRRVTRPVASPAVGVDASLAPGSYLATITAPGRALARHPFVLKRGERLVIADLPPEQASVPSGFVYVSAGRFRYGSAATDGERRDFFHTVPIHEVETRAYFIAERETTYRQWLAYVRALPEPQRAAALPRVDKGGFQGALSLSVEADGRYRLTFAPNDKTYSALEGERIIYAGRQLRSQQDWLDMPVSGVSVADAEAFAAYLRDTGAVAGARLCTELEWERAVRGADGREYPHGDRLLPSEANFDDTYAKVPSAMGPDAAGSYPQSRSPFGLLDAAGNVWEWTKSQGQGYAARGGSFYFGANSARATDREVTEPSFRDVSVGLRLCASVPNRRD